MSTALTDVPRKRGRSLNISEHRRNQRRVEGNDDTSIRAITKDAFKLFSSDDPSNSMKRLGQLKGIEPYRASLLLSILHPSIMPFLSDELCGWVVPNHPLKQAKMDDYLETFYPAVKSLIQRLGVSAVDVEKVAFVLKCEERVSRRLNLRVII